MIEYALIADFNFAQIKEDSARIDSYLESQKIEFVIDNSIDYEIKQYILWNIADLYTTHRAMETTSAKEQNPFLPSNPELHELLIHKATSTISIELLGWFDEELNENLFTLNSLGWIVVFNNLDVLYDK
jgi:hypothetical protein